MAAIVCVMDAVLRTPATDKVGRFAPVRILASNRCVSFMQVSVVTHVLNGTEYLAARPPRGRYTAVPYFLTASV